MSEAKQPVVGDVVIFHNPKGEAINALVNVVWGNYGGQYDGKTPEPNPTINVIALCQDEARQDTYGRQHEHHTSVPHVSRAGAHGYYWRRADEEPIKFAPPVSM